MKRIRTFVFTLAALAIAAAAIAQQQQPEVKTAERGRTSMMDDCRDVMKGDGMTGGHRPNEQWRKREGAK